MSGRWIVAGGVLAFAVTLAIVLGNRLIGDAAAIALGVSVGVIVGVPVGVFAALFVLRSSAAQPFFPPQRAEHLEESHPISRSGPPRQQATPETFAPKPASRREFMAVGGATLDTDDDTSG